MLSRPGKETLIKAVAQAIPTYMMSIFKIPDGLIDEIHAMLARFWWGSNDNSRKMHWHSWDHMCKPKAMGGMGFRDLKVFNQALLAKQVWRLHVESSSLLHSVLKARYFKHHDVIEAYRGYDPSYSWRSLWGAKSLLLEGLRWRVGNGTNINVWCNNWLPDSNIAPAPKIGSTIIYDLQVAECINHECGEWDTSILRANFSEEDCKAITNIPLSIFMPNDKLFW